MQILLEEEAMLMEKRSLVKPWLVCFASSLFFFYEFIQGNMFASIADNIMVDFHIQADQMAYLSSIYYLSNVIFLFVAGFLLDRFSTKKTILTAMMICVMGTFLLAYSHSFYLAMVCRFLTGIGSAFCFLGPIRIASRWFEPRKMAMVTGVIVTIAMTGGMLAQYPLTWLVGQLGWRDSVITIAWLGILMMIMMAYWIQDHPNGSSQSRPVEKNRILDIAKIAYLNPQTICAALYASLMNMAVAVFGAMMGSLYLMQRLGIEKTEASMINTMLFFGAIVGGPLVGYFSDRISLRVLPMKVGVIASLLTILVILYLPVSAGIMAVLFFLLGFFTAAQVISYALVVESSASSMTATAVSVISILTQGGYIIYQNLFSAILSWHGGMRMLDGLPVYSFDDYQTAALIIPTGLMVALIILFNLKETHCKHIHE